MTTPAYFVLNEHTLGYVLPNSPGWLCPLASTINGHDPKNGPVSIVNRLGLSIVPATLADFHRLRVDPTGHIALDEGGPGYFDDLMRRANDARRQCPHGEPLESRCPGCDREHREATA